MLPPNVFIGKVEDVPWKTDPAPDDDELDSFPEDVVQILGFNPEDEK